MNSSILSAALLSAIVCSPVVLTPSLASAQSCTEDTDCDPEDYCDHYPSSGDASGPVAPDCEPGQDCDDAPRAQPTPEEETPREGRCERGGRECTSDSECLPEHYCAFDDVSTASCPPGQSCGEIVPPEPSGRCEHQPYRCDSDADCPEPAVCGEDGECQYDIEPCEADDECAAEYECLSVRGEGRADDASDQDPMAVDPLPAGSSSDTSGVDALPGEPSQSDEQESDGKETSGVNSSAADSAGEEDAAEPAPDPVDPSELNTSETGPDDQLVAAEPESVAEDDDDERDEDIGICFPKFTPCTSDDDCNDGWVCAEVDEVPPNWGDAETACLPPGIAAALNGDLDVKGGGEGESTSGQADSDGDSIAEEDDPLVTPGSDGDGSQIELGTQGGSEGSTSNGGCSVRAVREGNGTGSWLAALALGFVLSRRRFSHGDGRTAVVAHRVTFD